MNPLTNVRNIQNLNKRELDLGVPFSQSWHQQYRDSAWVFIGGLEYELTEGDIICLFSQYGEVVNINLVRDKKTGKSKGFAFLCYENQLATVLAVDNLNSIQVCGRTLRVDHVEEYRVPKMREDMAPEQQQLALEGCAPQLQDDGMHTKAQVKEEPIDVKCETEQSVDDLVLPPRLFGDTSITRPGSSKLKIKKKKKEKKKKIKKSKKNKKLKKKYRSSSDSSSSEFISNSDSDVSPSRNFNNGRDDFSRKRHRVAVSSGAAGVKRVRVGLEYEDIDRSSYFGTGAARVKSESRSSDDGSDAEFKSHRDSSRHADRRAVQGGSREDGNYYLKRRSSSKGDHLDRREVHIVGYKDDRRRSREGDRRGHEERGRKREGDDRRERGDVSRSRR